MRLPITITNVNAKGQVTDKWKVRIGKEFQWFDEDNFRAGIAWIKSKLRNPSAGKNPEK